MNSSIVETLEEAKRLVEQGWTQWCYARDEKGIDLPYCAKKAALFCVAGACHRAARDLGMNPEGWEAIEALRILKGALPRPYTRVTQFNDECGQSKEAVLALFDRAIASAQENN